ncbi:hypothetical protein RRG08_066461 [Elysia crispata]|uniref:Uncharacterized protein n=1 Tax=Elysia crispata TaxID=231223 RepID=A0AAE0YIG0_9GAST|nr:hypothetical protein RRG08_066461 [Elysia crispata]
MKIKPGIEGEQQKKIIQGEGRLGVSDRYERVVTPDLALMNRVSNNEDIMRSLANRVVSARCPTPGVIVSTPGGWPARLSRASL